MDYAQQLEVTWQIDVINSDGTLVAFGGALCFHSEGYLVTALHVVQEVGDDSGDDECEDNGSEDDKNFSKIIAKCRGRRMEDNNEFISAKVVYKAPSLDLAILKLDSGNRRFPCKYPTRKIKMSIGDELAIHGHASFIPYSSIFGKVGYPYESCTNLRGQLRDLTTIIGDIDDMELCSLKEKHPIPSFRTAVGLLTLDIYGGNDFSDLNKNLKGFHPNLPLIEMASETGGGFSGCPVFGRRDNKLIGILILGDTECSYIVPVDVVSYMVKLFEKDMPSAT